MNILKNRTNKVPYIVAVVLIAAGITATGVEASQAFSENPDRPLAAFIDRMAIKLHIDDDDAKEITADANIAPEATNAAAQVQTAPETTTPQEAFNAPDADAQTQPSTGASASVRVQAAESSATVATPPANTSAPSSSTTYSIKGVNVDDEGSDDGERGRDNEDEQEIEDGD